MRLFFYKPALLFLIAFASNAKSQGQYYYYNNKYLDNDVIWEFGLSAGGMYSLTDVGKKQYSAFIPGRLDYKSTKFNGGVYAGVLYRNFIGARLEATYGSVYAVDSTGSPDRKVRNLSYRSDIREVSLIGELHPLELTNWEKLPAVAPYLIGGVGWFSFNPQAKYGDDWVDLQPLRTAGQGFAEFPERQPYKLSAVCIPFGVGFKYDISPVISSRFEIVERFAFTDYLDDASAGYIDPELFYNYFSADKAEMAAELSNRSGRNLSSISRGGQMTKDKYLTINFKIGFMLGRERIR